MNDFLKRQGMRIFWRYHRLRSSWPIWYYVLNREPRRRWRSIGFTPGERERTIAATVARDGIAVLHITDLFPASVLDKLIAHTTERVGRIGGGAAARSAGNRVTLGSGIFSGNTKKYQKDFLVDLWGEGDPPPLDTENSFIRLALDEHILGIVGTYLGLCPRFLFSSLLSTLVRPPGMSEQYSQRWHRDPEDRKMAKMFLYLTDVEESGAGPFTYVKGSQRGGRFGHLFPQHPPVGSYPPPGAVERAVPPDAIQTCFGKTGTLIFCDTTGLHRGGYSTTKERIMFTASYVSNASTHPARYLRPAPSALAALRPLARYAISQ
ncbi:MAG: hypothetical protein Q8R35_04230 [bacterium]|nr:hypothetical protein [bacterium]